MYGHYVAYITGHSSRYVIGSNTFAILNLFKAEGVVDAYIIVATGVARVLEVGEEYATWYKQHKAAQNP